MNLWLEIWNTNFNTFFISNFSKNSPVYLEVDIMCVAQLQLQCNARGQPFSEPTNAYYQMQPFVPTLVVSNSSHFENCWKISSRHFSLVLDQNIFCLIYSSEYSISVPSPLPPLCPDRLNDMGTAKRRGVTPLISSYLVENW